MGPSVWLGVRLGSQKEGSLVRRASRCSASICRIPASSASRIISSARAGKEEKEYLRFVPRAVGERREKVSHVGARATH